MNTELKTKINVAQFAYGMKNDNVIRISEVEKGLACGCECIGCGSPLIARKGDVKVHHFAHHDGNKNNCNESILHKLGKQIIQDKCAVGIAPLTIEVKEKDIVGRYHNKEFTDKEYTLQFNKVIPEQSAGDFQPDLTCFTDDGVIFIEIVVSNDVSPEKADKVKERGVATLSIDISACSAMSDMEELIQAVMYDSPRYWVFHPDHEQIQQEMKEELEEEIALINDKIRQVVTHKYDLVCRNTITEVPAGPILEPKPNQVLLLGFSSGYGYSRKKGRDFDCSLLMCAKLIQGYSSTNYNLRGNGGYDIEKVSFAESLIPKLDSMTFPCVVEFEFKMVTVYGRPQMIVSNIVQ